MVLAEEVRGRRRPSICVPSASGCVDMDGSDGVRDAVPLYVTSAVREGPSWCWRSRSGAPSPLDLRSVGHNSVVLFFCYFCYGYGSDICKFVQGSFAQLVQTDVRFSGFVRRFKSGFSVDSKAGLGPG